MPQRAAAEWVSAEGSAAGRPRVRRTGGPGAGSATPVVRTRTVGPRHSSGLRVLEGRDRTGSVGAEDGPAASLPVTLTVATPVNVPPAVLPLRCTSARLRLVVA